jgi:hypothetical protein
LIVLWNIYIIGYPCGSSQCSCHLFRKKEGYREPGHIEDAKLYKLRACLEVFLDERSVYGAGAGAGAAELVFLAPPYSSKIAPAPHEDAQKQLQLRGRLVRLRLLGCRSGMQSRSQSVSKRALNFEGSRSTVQGGVGVSVIDEIR